MATYIPRGVCSRKIDFEIDQDGLVRNVKFTAGCSGNTAGVAKLVEGRPASEIIELLKGVNCGFKKTSCPDQLALALEGELLKR
ncbi:MAG: TIGR03905 family TSCPD domain-containing protein [Coriobacteriia bacterium]|nr:TIGR03905 family TSCPD domain-containing protein [Coriobacteriia bacterium]